MSAPGLYNLPALLRQLAANSEYAFTYVFDYYRPQIYGVALHMLKSPVQAEEIVQDVFTKVWINRARLPEIRNFDGWLFMVARNLVVTCLRKQTYALQAQRDISAFQGGTANNTDHQLQLDLYRRLTEEAVNQLPPQQKKVYQLARMEGLSREAIAGKLGIAPSTVKAHLKNALKAIRLHFSKYMTAPICLALQGILHG